MDLERIGPYVIDQKIGSGGMGTVYLAQHAETGRDVAVKVLPPALAREDGFVARFEREIESLRKLANPQIVLLLDSGVEDSTYYYAMEYVEGETLTDRLRREKRLPWRDVVKFSLQICSALKSAHDAGIIHRDLKPSNLLLDKNNNIKLTDFGVAQVFAAGRLTMTGGIIGTAEYMSPEQAHGRRATKKSDLYSLGAVMFTMLTGRPPFVGKSTLEVIQKHKYGTFDRPSRYVEGIPRRLEETVCQLLEKDPDKRFPDALVLSKRLKEILRRADVADQAETQIQQGRSTGGGNSAGVLVQGDSPNPLDAVGGTLMRDLVKGEIEQVLGGSPLSRFFNNTWVLLGLFALLIAGGMLWFDTMSNRSRAETENAERPQEKKTLEDARRILENQIRLSKPNETDPFVLGAIHALDVGDTAKAERLMVSLQYLLQDREPPDPDFQEKVVEALEKVKSVRENRKKFEHPPVTTQHLLDQAGKLIEENEAENASQAVMIWSSIIDLYAHDPRCEKQVAEARRRLKEIQQPPLPDK